jgi:dihydrofolate synthase/folylpolyglutamate synthase
LLGNTLELIATEKAGIIKSNVPVVSGVDQDEPKKTIRKIAGQRGSRIWTLHEDFHLQVAPADLSTPGQQLQQFDCFLDTDSHQQRWSNLKLALNGKHQLNNAAVALATLACLQQQGWEIPSEAFFHGLANVHCPARIEVISEHPTVVIDTAHNRASIDSLVQYLDKQERASRQILVFATSRDKDISGMLALLLPCFDVVILTRYATNPRALDIEELEQECQLAISEFDSETTVPFIESAKDPSTAWQRARQLAETNDLVCITGSFYLAGEIRSLITDQQAAQIVS